MGKLGYSFLSDLQDNVLHSRKCVSVENYRAIKKNNSPYCQPDKYIFPLKGLNQRITIPGNGLSKSMYFIV